MTTKRIYLVTAEEGVPDRLIEAHNAAAAFRHASAPIKVTLATQADLVRLVGQHVIVEKAE